MCGAGFWFVLNSCGGYSSCALGPQFSQTKTWLLRCVAFSHLHLRACRKNIHPLHRTPFPPLSVVDNPSSPAGACLPSAFDVSTVSSSCNVCPWRLAWIANQASWVWWDRFRNWNKRKTICTIPVQVTASQWRSLPCSALVELQSRRCDTAPETSTVQHSMARVSIDYIGGLHVMHSELNWSLVALGYRLTCLMLAAFCIRTETIQYSSDRFFLLLSPIGDRTDRLHSDSIFSCLEVSTRDWAAICHIMILICSDQSSEHMHCVK